MRKTVDGRAKSVRGDILAAARELFAEKGYRDTTVREIARRAGANGAAVNYYFRSKDALYEAVFDEAFETFGRPLGDLVGSVRDQATWRAALEKWFDFMLGLFLLDDNLATVLSRVFSKSPLSLENMRKLTSQNGTDGYIIRYKTQILLALPDSPEDIESMFSEELLSYISDKLSPKTE